MLDLTKLMLNSTQIEVEVGVELDNYILLCWDGLQYFLFTNVSYKVNLGAG